MIVVNVCDLFIGLQGAIEPSSRRLVEHDSRNASHFGSIFDLKVESYRSILQLISMRTDLSCSGSDGT